MTAACRKQAGGILLTWDFRRGSPTAPRPLSSRLGRTAHIFDRSGVVVRDVCAGIRKGCIIRRRQAFLSRRTLARHKACPWWPGDFRSPPRGPQGDGLMREAAWLSWRARSFGCGCRAEAATCRFEPGGSLPWGAVAVGILLESKIFTKERRRDSPFHLADVSGEISNAPIDVQHP